MFDIIYLTKIQLATKFFFFFHVSSSMSVPVNEPSIFTKRIKSSSTKFISEIDIYFFSSSDYFSYVSKYTVKVSQNVPSFSKKYSSKSGRAFSKGCISMLPLFYSRNIWKRASPEFSIEKEWLVKSSLSLLKMLNPTTRSAPKTHCLLQLKSRSWLTFSWPDDKNFEIYGYNLVRAYNTSNKKTRWHLYSL